MKDILTLGIESSCDETSISVVKNGRDVLSNVINTQIDIHTLYGGVVPEIASRNHILNISAVMHEALKQANVELKDIDNIDTDKIIDEAIEKANISYKELENIEKINKFLKENKNFRLENISLNNSIVKAKKNGVLEILPDEYSCDGFFIAKLKKMEEKC